MQPAMTSGFFDAADGLKLYCDWYPPSGAARATVVVLHGYGEHAGRYAEVARRLAGKGFAVVAFDYRGHGQAGGRRGHCHRFEEYLSDLTRACAHAREAAGDHPIALLAHSHGGLIALKAMCTPGALPAGVTAAVLSSPFLGLALKVPLPKQIAGRLVSRVLPRLAMKNGIDPATVSHDPAIVKAYAEDRFNHKVATARWFTEMSATQSYVLAHAGAIKLPSLWLLGGDDRIASAATTRAAYEAAGGEKQLIVYPGYFHEVLNEVGREAVIGDVEAWLSSRFKAA